MPRQVFEPHLHAHGLDLVGEAVVDRQFFAGTDRRLLMYRMWPLKTIV